MKRQVVPLLLLFLLVSACASTRMGKELQFAKAIVGANESVVTALDFDIITADTGEALQGITRVATLDLKRAIAARRAGRKQKDVDRIFNLVRDGLLEVARVLEGKK